MHKEVGLLLSKLHKLEGIRQSSLDEIVKSFTPPAYFKGMHAP